MAPNLPTELEPPLSSSEEEEEEEGSESEEGSDSESEGGNKTTQSLPPVTKIPADDDDDDESGSESESVSDSALEKSRKTDPTIKPNVSKPVEDPDKSSTKKPISKPSLPASPNPTVKSGAGFKRPAESESKDSKRAKKKLPVSEDEENGAKDDQKKQLFQRLWSEDDEIVILKGIMDYVAEKGTDPVNDLNVFHDFIKTSLHIDVTKTQLQDKVRRLKKKFENNASKEKQGKDRTFAKAHEQKAYDLSKKIWATDGKLLGIDSSKLNGSARKNLNQRAGKSLVLATMEVEQNARPVQTSVAKRNLQFGRSVGDPALESEILNDGLELIERSKRVELEEKWKKLRLEEYELYLKRVELIREQTTLILEALKSGEN